jgi:hypothetical protein
MYPDIDLDELRLELTVTPSAVAGFAEAVGQYGYDLVFTYNETAFVINGLGFVQASLTVTPRPLTITAGSASKVYDGSALTTAIFTSVGLRFGDTLSAAVSGTQTAVGSSQSVISGYQILRGSTNVTRNYDVTTLAGTLTVSAASNPSYTPPTYTPTQTTTGTTTTTTATDDTTGAQAEAAAPAATTTTTNPPASNNTTIEDAETPLAAPDSQSGVQWALANLLLALAALVLAVVVIIATVVSRRRPQDNRGGAASKSSGVLLALGIVLGVAAPIVFLFTENLSMPMGNIDGWTPLMAVLAVAQVALTIVCALVNRPTKAPGSSSLGAPSSLPA